MKFMEMLELLKQHKMMVRESWKVEDGYLVFMPGMKHIWKILTCPTPNAGNYALSLEELDAEDWKIFEG